MTHPRHALLSLGLLLAILGLGLTVFLGVAPTAGARSPERMPPAVREFREFGSWRYLVTTETDDGADVNVVYDYLSIEGLKAFARANVDLSRQLRAAGTQHVEAVVTFNRPLSLAEFEGLVSAHKIQVRDYTIRMTAPNGQRWTIGGAPLDETLVPQVPLDRQVAFVRDRAPGALFDGVVDMTASFDVNQYEQLRAASEIFIVDVTPTVVKREMKQQKPRLDERKLIIDAPRPYWFMENQGLQNFR